MSNVNYLRSRCDGECGAEMSSQRISHKSYHHNHRHNHGTHTRIFHENDDDDDIEFLSASSDNRLADATSIFNRTPSYAGQRCTVVAPKPSSVAVHRSPVLLSNPLPTPKSTSLTAVPVKKKKQNGWSKCCCISTIFGFIALISFFFAIVLSQGSDSPLILFIDSHLKDLSMRNIMPYKYEALSSPKKIQNLENIEEIFSSLQVRLSQLEDNEALSKKNVDMFAEALKDVSEKVSNIERSKLNADYFDLVLNENMRILQSSILDVEQEQVSLYDRLKSVFDALEKERETAENLKVKIDRFNASGNCSTKCRDLALSTTSEVAPTSLASYSNTDVNSMIWSAIEKYDADKTGLADYALESSGGSILSIRCTETFSSWTRQLSFWGIPLFSRRYSPRTVISSEVVPGNCWAFKGSFGYLVIKLSRTIQVSGVSYEHIPRELSPDGHIDSAPKKFQLFGLLTESDENALYLGEFQYDNKGKPLQYFPITVKNYPVPIIEMKVMSNHGNPDFTCLYRLRVHGEPVERV